MIILAFTTPQPCDQKSGSWQQVYIYNGSSILQCDGYWLTFPSWSMRKVNGGSYIPVITAVDLLNNCGGEKAHNIRNNSLNNYLA